MPLPSLENPSAPSEGSITSNNIENHFKPSSWCVVMEDFYSFFFATRQIEIMKTLCIPILSSFNLLRFGRKPSLMRNSIFQQGSLCPCQQGRGSGEPWCPEQRCSSTLWGVGCLLAGPPAPCCSLRASSTGSPCWAPLHCVHTHREQVFLSEGGQNRVRDFVYFVTEI